MRKWFLLIALLGAMALLAFQQGCDMEQLQKLWEQVPNQMPDTDQF